MTTEWTRGWRLGTAGDETLGGGTDTTSRGGWRGYVEDAIAPFGGTLTGVFRSTGDKLASQANGAETGVTAQAAELTIYSRVQTLAPLPLLVWQYGLIDVYTGSYTAVQTLNSVDRAIRRAFAAGVRSLLWLPLIPLYGSSAVYDTVRAAVNSGMATRIQTHRDEGRDVFSCVDFTTTNFPVGLYSDGVYRLASTGYAVMGPLVVAAVEDWMRRVGYAEASAL